jgi:tetratricopeptide (TPR) repeat protein
MPRLALAIVLLGLLPRPAAAAPAWRSMDLPPEAARLTRTADSAASAQTAVRLYAQALRQFPSNGPALFGLAQTLLDLDRPADALKIFLRMDSLFPDDPSIHILIGNAIARLPDPRRADVHQGLAAARRAADLQPDAPEAWHVLSILLYLDGDYAEATAAARRALELDADNPSTPETSALYQQQETACTHALLVFSPLD